MAQMKKRQFLKVFGVFMAPSHLLHSIAHARCFDKTPKQIQGPFFKSGSPYRKKIYDGNEKSKFSIKITGYVYDTNCNPVPNANLEFWHASPFGSYDNIGYEFRGQQKSDRFGRFFLETLRPGSYPGRTPHIHVTIERGIKKITTQLYFSNETQNKKDYFYNSSLELMEKYNEFHFNFFI